MTLRQTCTYGHDKASHYEDPDGRHCDCLCRDCKCWRYEERHRGEER